LFYAMSFPIEGKRMLKLTNTSKHRLVVIRAIILEQAEISNPPQ
jgi:hypothetical protein